MLFHFPVLAQKNKASKAKAAEFPDFQKFKSQLPEPFLENSPEFVTLYYEAWKVNYENLKTPKEDSSNQAFENLWHLPAWKYASHIYDFSQKVKAPIYPEITPNSSTYRNLLIAQPWLEWEYNQMSEKQDRLTTFLPYFQSYFRQFKSEYVAPESKTGLFGKIISNPADFYAFPKGSSWAGLSAQASLYLQYLAKIEKLAGQKTEADSSRARSKYVNNAINQYMWNPKKGFYFDIDDEGIQNSFRNSDAALTLLAQTPNPIQARQILNVLYDKSSFNTMYPFPSTPINDINNQKYAYPISNPISNYGILRGMISSNSSARSCEMASKMLRYHYMCYKTSNYLYGALNSDTTIPVNISEYDFSFGQEHNDLLPIAALIECVIGIQVTENGIVWNINRTDRHGLKNLRIGNKKFSFDSKFRLMNDDEADITIIASDAMKITVNVSKRTKVLVLHKGTNRFLL